MTSYVPLKLKDSANFEEFDTTSSIASNDENYLAYQVGLALSEADSSEPASLSLLADLSTDSAYFIGDLINTEYDSAIGTGGSGSFLTFSQTVQSVFQRDGTVSFTDSDYRIPIYTKNYSGADQLDDTTANLSQVNLLRNRTKFDYVEIVSVSNGDDLTIKIPSERNVIFDRFVGTSINQHDSDVNGYATHAGTVEFGNALHEPPKMTVEAAVGVTTGRYEDSDNAYVINFRNATIGGTAYGSAEATSEYEIGDNGIYVNALTQNNFQTIINEMDSSARSSLVDRLNRRIFTSDYPGSYRLSSVSPDSADWSLDLSNVMTDTRDSAGNYSLQYNIYKRTSMAAPNTVLPFAIKRSNGDSGDYQGLQRMTPRQVKYSLGQEAKKRIASSSTNIGNYRILSSATGTPSDIGLSGTWTAKGTATDTRQAVVDANYTRTRSSSFSRLRTSTFAGNYTRTRSSAFSEDYTTTRESTYSANYTRTRASNYSLGFVGDFIANYTTERDQNFTRNRIAPGALSYTRTRSSTFTGNFSRILQYTTNYTGDFVGPVTSGLSVIGTADIQITSQALFNGAVSALVTVPSGTKSVILCANVKTNGNRRSLFSAVTFGGTAMNEAISQNNTPAEYTFDTGIYNVNYTSTGVKTVFFFLSNNPQVYGMGARVIFLNKAFSSYSPSDADGVSTTGSSGRGDITNHNKYANGITVASATCRAPNSGAYVAQVGDLAYLYSPYIDTTGWNQGFIQHPSGNNSGSITGYELPTGVGPAGTISFRYMQNDFGESAAVASWAPSKFEQDYDVTYTGNFTRVGQYTSNFSRNFTGNYTRDAVYTGNYTGDFLGDFTRNRQATRPDDFTRDFTGDYSNDYTRTRVSTYTRNATGVFTGGYTGYYTGDFTSNFTRISTATTGATQRVLIGPASSNTNYWWSSSNQTNRVSFGSFESWFAATNLIASSGSSAISVENYNTNGTYLHGYYGHPASASVSRTNKSPSYTETIRTATTAQLTWIRGHQPGLAATNGQDWIGASSGISYPYSNSDYIQAGPNGTQCPYGATFTKNLTRAYALNNSSQPTFANGIYPVGFDDDYGTGGIFCFYANNNNVYLVGSNWLDSQSTSSNRGITVCDFSTAVSTNYTGNYSTDFLQNFTRLIETNFTGDFAGNYSRNFTGNYTRDFTRTRTSTYLGAETFSRDFTGNYEGNYTRNFTRTFEGNYTRDFTGNYEGNYQQNYIGNYVGEFLGNYAGDSIGSGSSNIETYTLYVRTA